LTDARATAVERAADVTGRSAQLVKAINVVLSAENTLVVMMKLT